MILIKEECLLSNSARALESDFELSEDGICIFISFKNYLKDFSNSNNSLIASSTETEEMVFLL